VEPAFDERDVTSIVNGVSMRMCISSRSQTTSGGSDCYSRAEVKMKKNRKGTVERALPT